MKKLFILLALYSFASVSIATGIISNQKQDVTSQLTTTHKHARKHKQVKKQPHNVHVKKATLVKHKTKKHRLTHKRKTQYITSASGVVTNTNAKTNEVSLNSSALVASGTIPKEFIDDSVDNSAIKRQPRLYSYSAIALNATTGQIIVSKNPNTSLPIASITKLMTAMVVLDSGVDLDSYVTITSDDVDNLRNTYSRLKIGMQFRRSDLLLLALMSSENRAAHALGRTTFKGGLNVFIAKMNAKAKSLGMTHTQYFDPTGLTDMNKSTANDLAKQVQAAYTYDKIRQDTTTKNADVMFGPNYTHRYINSDALVRGSNMQIELSKTGFINEAGHCLAIYSIIDNKPIVMIFLNSSGKSGRIIDAMAVKNFVEHRKG